MVRSAAAALGWIKMSPMISSNGNSFIVSLLDVYSHGPQHLFLTCHSRQYAPALMQYFLYTASLRLILLMMPAAIASPCMHRCRSRMFVQAAATPGMIACRG
jgi:hypothetical protein